MPETVRYRTGRHVGRTIYAQQGPEPSDTDPLVGVMDTRELAEKAAAGMNAGESAEAYYRERIRLRSVPAEPLPGGSYLRVAPRSEQPGEIHHWFRLSSNPEVRVALTEDGAVVGIQHDSDLVGPSVILDVLREIRVAEEQS